MTTESRSELEQFKDFLKNVCRLYVIDHADRAGNGFFQTLFNEHPPNEIAKLIGWKIRQVKENSWEYIPDKNPGVQNN